MLSVGYPLAPVGPGAVGGAEQILTMLDEALVEAGHTSAVVACAGSETRGILVATPAHPAPFDEATRAAAWTDHRRAISRAINEYAPDVVHMHGLDFSHYLPTEDVPVLATLHLPPGWYPSDVFELTRPDTYLQCVSRAQERCCPEGARLLPAIENGVAIDMTTRLRPMSEREYVLALGRICPEKGFDIALDAAHAAGVQLLLAGQVFPYSEHERYYTKEIVPRLYPACRFVGALAGEAKRSAIAGARCVLIPSTAPETSSLVAMEALAAGTPVVAFPAGALAEIVEHGRTGFLVHDAAEMADAIGACDKIDPEECRMVARERFSAERMTREYLERYTELAVTMALRAQ